MTDRIKAWLRAKAPAVLLSVGTTVLAFAIGGLVQIFDKPTTTRTVVGPTP